MPDDHASIRSLMLELGIDGDLLDATPPDHWLRLVTDFSLWGHGATLSVADMARRMGVEDDVLRRWWMRFGFGDPGDREVFREEDVEFFEMRASADAFFGDQASTEFALRFGVSMRQVAEAAVALFFNRLGEQDELPLEEQLRNRRDGTQLFRLVPNILVPTVLFHAFRDALDYRQSVRQAGEGETCVGFCDLVGSTSLMNSQASRATLQVLGEFEVVASALAVGFGGHIVKFVGDEAMWTVATPDDAMAIGTALIEWVACHPPLRAARVGIAFGEVIHRDGDLYGPTVNRAARLAARADAGAMIVDADLTSVGPAESIMIKGFAEPVAVRTISGPAT